jgi:hypothetical protein
MQVNNKKKTRVLLQNNSKPTSSPSRIALSSGHPRQQDHGKAKASQRVAKSRHEGGTEQGIADSSSMACFHHEPPASPRAVVPPATG